MSMNYGWPKTSQGIKLVHVAHQKDTILKTTFRTVSGKNLGRDPQYERFIFDLFFLVT